MKPFLSLLLIGCVFWSVSTAMGESRIALGPSFGAAGSSGALLVSFATDDVVAGLQIDLTYNPLDVTITGDPAVGSAGPNHAVNGGQIEPGRYRVVMVSLGADLVQTGVLFSLPIRFVRTVPATSRAFSLGEVMVSSRYGLQGTVSFTPFVAIQGVTDGMEVDPGQALAIEAVAFGFEDALDGVEILVNGQRVGMSSTAPFSTSWTAIEPGSVLVTAIGRGDGSAFEALPVTLKVKGNPFAGFNQWREFFFTAQQLADPAVSGANGNADVDGDTNLFEFISGRDPTVPDPGDSLEHSVVRNAGKDYLALTIRRRANMNDTEVRVVSSASLDFVTTTPAVAIKYEQAGDYEIVTYRDQVPLSGAQRRFMRVQLDHTPPNVP